MIDLQRIKLQWHKVGNETCFKFPLSAFIHDVLKTTHFPEMHAKYLHAMISKCDKCPNKLEHKPLFYVGILFVLVSLKVRFRVSHS